MTHFPAAYHADALVTLRGEGNALAVVVEVQRKRDSQKHMSWPAYVATARARLKCPVMLLVICHESGVARWARRPIALGHPGLVLTPLVLGPKEVPVLTDADTDNVAPEREFARRYYGEGEARGEARAVLTVLSTRGIDVPEDVRVRISECSDIEQLESWVVRAVTADSVDDLFA
ncbi:MAG: hypothetical protein ACRDP6_03055 [Actinoallomurus sp.]